jgi:hypothetical protein
MRKLKFSRITNHALRIFPRKNSFCLRINYHRRPNTGQKFFNILRLDIAFGFVILAEVSFYQEIDNKYQIEIGSIWFGKIAGV